MDLLFVHRLTSNQYRLVYFYIGSEPEERVVGKGYSHVGDIVVLVTYS